MTMDDHGREAPGANGGGALRSLLGTGVATRARCGNDITATEPFAPGADGAALRSSVGVDTATILRP